MPLNPKVHNNLAKHLGSKTTANELVRYIAGLEEDLEDLKMRLRAVQGNMDTQIQELKQNPGRRPRLPNQIKGE